MLEIKVTLTVDPKLGALLNKLGNTLSFDNSLPFTAEQAAPVKPATNTPVKPAPSVPVNPTPVGTTTAPTTAAAPVTRPVQTAATAVSPTVPVTPTATNAAPAPAMTPPPTTASTVPPQSTVPTAPVPTYTLDQLQAAVGPLIGQGKAPQLQALLKKYNVSRMPDLKPEQLGAFATDLRGLGAQI